MDFVSFVLVTFDKIIAFYVMILSFFAHKKRVNRDFCRHHAMIICDTAAGTQCLFIEVLKVHFVVWRASEYERLSLDSLDYKRIHRARNTVRERGSINKEIVLPEFVFAPFFPSFQHFLVLPFSNQDFLRQPTTTATPPSSRQQILNK